MHEGLRKGQGVVEGHTVTHPFQHVPNEVAHAPTGIDCNSYHLHEDGEHFAYKVADSGR